MVWRCRFFLARRSQHGRVIAEMTAPDAPVDFHTAVDGASHLIKKTTIGRKHRSKQPRLRRRRQRIHGLETVAFCRKTQRVADARLPHVAKASHLCVVL